MTDPDILNVENDGWAAKWDCLISSEPDTQSRANQTAIQTNQGVDNSSLSKENQQTATVAGASNPEDTFTAGECEQYRDSLRRGGATDDMIAKFDKTLQRLVESPTTLSPTASTSCSGDGNNKTSREKGRKQSNQSLVTISETDDRAQNLPKDLKDTSKKVGNSAPTASAPSDIHDESGTNNRSANQAKKKGKKSKKDKARKKALG